MEVKLHIIPIKKSIVEHFAYDCCKYFITDPFLSDKTEASLCGYERF